MEERWAKHPLACDKHRARWQPVSLNDGSGQQMLKPYRGSLVREPQDEAETETAVS